MGLTIRYRKSRGGNCLIGGLAAATLAGVIYDGAFNNGKVSRYLADKLFPQKTVMEYPSVQIDAGSLMNEKKLTIWEISNSHLKSEGGHSGISQYIGENLSEIRRMNEAKNFDNLAKKRIWNLRDWNGDGHVLSENYRQYEMGVKNRMTQKRKHQTQRK